MAATIRSPAPTVLLASTGIAGRRSSCLRRRAARRAPRSEMTTISAKPRSCSSRAAAISSASLAIARPSRSATSRRLGLISHARAPSHAASADPRYRPPASRPTGGSVPRCASGSPGRSRAAGCRSPRCRSASATPNRASSGFASSSALSSGPGSTKRYWSPGRPSSTVKLSRVAPAIGTARIGTRCASSSRDDRRTRWAAAGEHRRRPTTEMRRHACHVDPLPPRSKRGAVHRSLWPGRTFSVQVGQVERRIERQRRDRHQRVRSSGAGGGDDQFLWTVHPDAVPVDLAHRAARLFGAPRPRSRPRRRCCGHSPGRCDPARGASSQMPVNTAR